MIQFSSITVNEVKFINYETHSILAVKYLYIRQRLCHYSASFISFNPVLIIVNVVKLINLDQILFQIKSSSKGDNSVIQLDSVPI